NRALREEHEGRQQTERDEIEDDRISKSDQRQRIPYGHWQAVVAAQRLDAVDEIVHHLRERQGDHDEKDPGRADRDSSDRRGEYARDQDGERPVRERNMHAVLRRERNGIRTDRKKRGVPEAEHSPVTDDKVERRDGERVDDDASRYRDPKRLPGKRCGSRQANEAERGERKREPSARQP